MGEDAPLVTVTVCVRNGADWVEGCMQSLLEQTWRPLEIVAVDDGSSDGSDERLQAFHDPYGEVPVRVLRRPAEGLAAGRNAAARAARGTWIAITDIDVRPMPDWIEALMAARNGLEDEDVMAVTGRTIFEEGDDLVSRLRSIEIERKYRSRPRRTSLANGPCSMFRADALLEVGGFEPAWYHAEDMEVSLNMVAAGGTIVYTPEAMVRHVPEEGRQRFAAKRRRDARAHVRIARRWP
ncbi:MAG: glycosyltransferase family 2 protein, partial [Candidatus Thermoplasmatota archaeon]|nr:glycosyltransferase family 2 protein [Candidatus Thermoplasmatota archaeon]